MSTHERAVIVAPQRAPRGVTRSGKGPASSAATALLSAQHALGNQLVQRRLLADAIQCQPITVAPPEDEHEREADRLAELALRMPDPPPMPSAEASPETLWRAEDEERKKRAQPTPPPKPPPKPSIPKPAPGGTPQKPEAGKPPPGKKTEVEPPAPPKPPEEAMTPEERKKKEEEPAVAMKAEPGAAIPEVTAAVSEGIGARHGAGRPLGVERGFYERRLGRDLSAVRVHDDTAAAHAASDLGAKAFTYGEDVFFGPGRYQPHTPEGSRLLAHELVHTVQQRPGASLRRTAIQRQTEGATIAPPPGPGGSAPAATATVDATTLETSVGKLEDPTDDEKKTIRFDQIEIPRFKTQDHRGALYAEKKPLRQVKNFSRGEPRQREKWRTSVPVTDQVTSALQTKHAQAPEAGKPYVFKAPARGPGGATFTRYFIGDLAAIGREMTLPSWDTEGQPHAYDVDHIVELQLAGYDRSDGHWANQLPNMELLDASANRSSGSRIAAAINARVTNFLKEARGDSRIPAGAETLKRRFNLQFDQAVPEARADPEVGRRDYWRQSHLESGEHVRVSEVKVAHPSEVGTAGDVKIFSRETGGIPFTFEWENSPEPKGHERNFLKPFTVTRKQFNVTSDQLSNPKLGELTIELPTANAKWEAVPEQKIPIPRLQGLPFAGHVDRQAVRQSLSSFRKKGASPIRLEDDPDIMPGGGIGVRGQIMPEVPALEGVGIDFELAGDDLRVFKAFSIDDVKVPRPLSVTEVTLVVSAGTASGLALTGRVDFGIERVGQGFLQAQAGTERGIEFDGEFNFDTRLFNPARITVGYHDRTWTGGGELGIPAGKVPGIRRATIRATYSEGRLDASGNADLDVPGVEQGALTLSYSEAEGLAIGGRFQLTNRIPGIRGGQIEARVQERPEQNDYRVTARGEAQPAIPGVDATISVAYDDGAITIEGDAAYSRGPVSGRLHVGATNRPVDAAGNPAPDGTPGERLTAYGGGSATVQLTPWLQGTVGLRLLPNGEIELAGAIGLPATLEIFPEKAYTRNILTIGIDIPIVGVAVAGQRIGIFATIQGGLDFSAGVGPGQLRELGLEITFNPDHPDQTHVQGGAQLHIPAHAGLRLFVRGGLGAGIPIVSATAGLEVGGALGLEGAVDAGVHVDWMPTRGLVLDAAGEIYVEPRFRFDITGYVLVEADLLLTTIELYSKRWQLAAIEYGSGLRLGMRFPIHYQEGQPFDISWSDVQWQIPDVNPREVLSGLIQQLA
jgi:outer membrane biosynthesis protein TonB